jgi:hypothetical protein
VKKLAVPLALLCIKLRDEAGDALEIAVGQNNGQTNLQRRDTFE